MSSRTVESNSQSLHYFLVWCVQQNIESELASYNELLDYVRELNQRGLKNITVKQYLLSISHYFNWLIKREIREDNPVKRIAIKGVKRKTLYQILTPKELESLYMNYPEKKKEDKNQNLNWFKTYELASKRSRVMLGLFIWQGITSEEILRLKTEDLKLREGKIYIPRGRRSNERLLKLEASQIMDLMEYSLQTRNELLKKTNQESEWLFPGGSPNQARHNLTEYLLKQLKILNPNIKNLQQIRTSVITHWLKQYNLREVQYMAGHRYVSSTESYLINDLDDLQEDISKYHPIG